MIAQRDCATTAHHFSTPVDPGPNAASDSPRAYDANMSPAQEGRIEGSIMGEKVDRSGKKIRPRTAERGKRYLCARCRKRSPRPVFAPAPWYCPNCASAPAANPM